MFGLQGGSAPAAPALFQGLEEGQMGHHSLPHSIGIPQQQMMLPQHQQADMQHLMAPATLPMPDAGPAGLHVSGPAFSGVEVHTSNMSIADDLLGIPGMGGTTGGMISLSDLQPGIPQSPIPGLPTQVNASTPDPSSPAFTALSATTIPSLETCVPPGL